MKGAEKIKHSLQHKSSNLTGMNEETEANERELLELQ